MRNILLSCLLFLSIGAYAQIYTINGFQSPSPGTGDQKGWAYSTRGLQSAKHNWGYHYDSQMFNVRVRPYSEFANIYYGGNIEIKNGYFDAIYTPTQKGNGEAVTCSAYFRSSHIGKANIDFRYSLDEGITWTTLGKRQDFANTHAIIKTEIIPAGVVTAANYSQFRFMIRITCTNPVKNSQYFLDNIELRQKSLRVPGCTTLTAPANNARNIPARTLFNWDLASGAYSYDVKIGTSRGDADVHYFKNLNIIDSYGLDVILKPNANHYVTIIGRNELGDAVGCTETTFTTGSNFFAPYCGPVPSRTPSLIAPITSVTLGETTYTSDTTATTLGEFEPHQSFVDKVFTIKNNENNIPITVKAIGDAQEGWQVMIYIDWENDGEINTSRIVTFISNGTRSTTIGSENVITFTSKLHIDEVPLGKKRMRIMFNNPKTWPSLESALCDVSSNTQFEDYTISYEKYLPVSDVDKKNVSVYPNPFKDILKISEVKDAKSITVADVSGKVVATPKISQELNLSHLSKGVYFITVSYHNGSTKSFKVIKE